MIYFSQEKTRNLRHASQFLVDTIHSVFNGGKSGSYLGPKIWNKYPLKLKVLTPLLVLKKKLENGNLRIAPVEFAKSKYQIWVLFKVLFENTFW